MHNRTIAALAASGLLAAFAAQAQKGAAYSAPAQEPEYARFTITGGATYLKPDLNGLDYLDSTSLEPTTAQTTIYSVDPGYQWGYYLAAGYMISSHYDVQASWTQLNTNNSDSASVSGDEMVFSTSNQYGYTLDGISPLVATSDETLNYEAFDITLGQYHKLRENLMSRLFAGVRYAKITNNTFDSYFEEDIDSSFFDSYDSQFSGWGPEVGVDLNYEVYDWFGVVGHFAAAFLVGELEASSDTFNSGDSKNGQVATQDNQEGSMIPALDAKLGLTFGVPFMQYDDRFMIEAGYQVAYYFNVVDQIQNQTTGRGNGNNFSVHNYSDVGIMGPYANLSVKF